MDRFSEYRIMWVLVLFDLPTNSLHKRSEFPFLRGLEERINTFLLIFVVR